MPQKADFVKKPLFHNSADMTILISVFREISMSKINIHRITAAIIMDKEGLSMEEAVKKIME